MTTEKFIEKQLAGYTSRATFDIESVKSLMRRVAWFKNVSFIGELDDIAEYIANKDSNMALNHLTTLQSELGREIPDRLPHDAPEVADVFKGIIEAFTKPMPWETQQQ